MELDVITASVSSLENAGVCVCVVCARAARACCVCVVVKQLKAVTV